ncbi:ParB N-terminal domain-containing protein [Ramlibacter sp. G-1-2-2]|uniref:ParB N-terminal domain-containing protein n=1 Tax=Ramlibacter agri TaxID=2728837 RepID=A0A848H0C3_9BURK|nr:ParB N-terminal domain-containing protein [Ramlibacter agri]NML42530.1 ParB N-terminal domain-containing protein [Ramlibacter agri]
MVTAKKTQAKTRTKLPAKRKTKEITWLATEDLDFDPQNPRFYRLHGKATDAKVVEEMLDDEGVQDLMSSIGQQGYFEGEPLLVVPTKGGKYIVVEGNRRLAALKLLNGELSAPRRKARSVQMLIDVAQETPTEVPCIVHKDRVDVLRYLGYRHITGIKEWDALSKAKYLAELRDTFYPDLDVEEQLRTIAREIGSRSDHVAKLLAGLKLYEQVERGKFFSRHNLSPDALDFSYVSTAISYSAIAEWLGLDGSGDVDAEGVDPKRVESLFYWMFVPQPNGYAVVRESRMLQQLAAVVKSDDALRALEKTGRLEDAYLHTDGPEQALGGALQQADAKLRLVWETLLQSSPSEEHLEAAKDIHVRAKKIYDQIAHSLGGD